MSYPVPPHRQLEPQSGFGRDCLVSQLMGPLGARRIKEEELLRPIALFEVFVGLNPLNCD